MIEGEIIEDPFYKKDGPVLLDEAVGLVDAVEPVFRDNGALAGLLLEPADTTVVRASADKAYGLWSALRMGKTIRPAK